MKINTDNVHSKYSGNKIFKFFIFLCIWKLCNAQNHPPQFIIDGQNEIVVKVKEGQETPVGTSIILHIKLLIIVNYFSK